MTASDAPARAPFSILVLCTGNSARSQLAEAILATRGVKRPMGPVVAASAGTRPASQVNEYAITALQFHGIAWRHAAPKHVDTLKDRAFDLVITVCDDAKEACPVFPGAKAQVHWGLPDPAVHISPATARAAFSATFDALAKRINALLRLPLETLAPDELRAQAQAIHDSLAAPPARTSARLRHNT